VKQVPDVGLADVQEVYRGAVGDLWELVMGEQIHMGGLASSMELAERAGIGAGMRGIDLCCCTGAGMRFLARFRGVEEMTGVDATERVVGRGRERCAAEGLGDRIRFVLGDVCASGLPDAAADFVWGEDAWCYVVDKPRLIAEAARMIRPGGIIAFTDWLEGPTPMTGEESDRFLHFMRFPSLDGIEDYRALLEQHGCEVIEAADTGRFAPCVDLYLAMLNQQLAFDALKIIDFDLALMEAMGAEMAFMQDLAHAGKLIQGRFIARKTP